MNTENNKNMNGRNIANIVLWIVIAVLLVVIVVEAIVAIVLNSDKGDGDKNDTNPTSSVGVVVTDGNTQKPGVTENTSQSPNTAQTPSATVSSGTTRPTGTAQNTPAPTPSNSPIGGGTTTGDLTAAKIIDPKSIDYSFLNGKSKDPFEDAAAGSYDWYPGDIRRDENGKITSNWDRYSSTLSVLAKNHGIYRKNTDQNVIYLTFDCGYEYGYTTKILDTLKEKNVKAIFFVTGGFVNDSSNHGLLKRMHNEGHLIGSHTENHKIMPTLSNEEFVEEMNTLYKTCKNILGNDFTMAYYRPPQGASSERDLALASYLGYNTVFWSATHPDYNVNNQPEHAKALAEIKSKIHPGVVYLLHAVSSTNAAILGDFISYAESEGFTFKRMDQ